MRTCFKTFFFLGLVLAGGLVAFEGTCSQILWDISHGVEGFPEDPTYYHPEKYHRLLLELMQDIGISVVISDTGILNEDLGQFDGMIIEVVTSFDTPYTATEAISIANFVENGGGLLILGDWAGSKNEHINPISAGVFGAETGVTTVWFNRFLSDFVDHPLFKSVEQLFLLTWGSLSVDHPSVPVARDSLGNIGVAVAEVGSGRVVVLGDTDIFMHSVSPAFPEGCCLFKADNETFARNIFGWLLHRTSRDMKEVALDDLAELIEWGENNGEKKVVKTAKHAMKHILKSLNINPKDPSRSWKKHTLWEDEAHLNEKHGPKVFEEEKKAAKKLKGLCKHLHHTPLETCLRVIELLLNADEALAQVALDEAKDTPVEDPKNEKRYDREIRKAEKEMEKAEREREKDHFDHAIDHYKKSWKHSIRAKKIAEGKRT